MNRIETLLSELGQASMCPENSSYNGITEIQSSESYRMKIESLYTDAVKDLYELNDLQRGIVISRIRDVRDCQEYFDIPTKETVNSLFLDFSSLPEDQRSKSLLEDYRYCTFVLECVNIQKDYLERFASLLVPKGSEEKVPGSQTDKEHDSPMQTAKGGRYLSVDDVVQQYRLPKNNIKSRKWRIENEFPRKGFDEIKGAKNSVSFNPQEVEDWIRNHK